MHAQLFVYKRPLVLLISLVAALANGIKMSAVTSGYRQAKSITAQLGGWLLLLVMAAPLTFAADTSSNARAFVEMIVANELKADANDHTKWMYRDDNDVPDGHTVRVVIQTAEGDLSKTIQKDGRALAGDEQKQDEEKIEQFVHDPNVREKQKRDREEDSEMAASLTKLLPEAFLWSFAGRQGALTTLRFKPDPKFHPPTRESRVFAAMEGVMVVNTKQKRIQQLKGTLTEDVDFGYGLLGKLEKGGTFEVQRTQIAPGIWDITATHIHIHGHALIFKSIGEEQDEITSNYRRTPPSLSLEAAAKMLEDGSAERMLK